MGPTGFTTTTHSFDFRVGGEWRYTMQHAEYGSFPNRVRYVEIEPGNRIVYDHDTGEENGPAAAGGAGGLGGVGAVEAALALSTPAPVVLAGEVAGAVLGDQEIGERGGLAVVFPTGGGAAAAGRALAEEQALALVPIARQRRGAAGPARRPPCSLARPRDLLLISCWTRCAPSWPPARPWRAFVRVACGPPSTSCVRATSTRPARIA